MRIMLCDDEPVTIDYYYGHLSKLFEKMGVSCVIDTCTDSGRLLAQLYNGAQWDVYFLDIDMPLINGLDLGKKIREQDRGCYLIYVSIHRERVYDSLETRPFRFIPKDEFLSRIEPCIRDILADCRTESESDFVVLENPTVLYRYRIADIIYAQSLDKYIRLFLTEGAQTESIRYKLSDLERQLLPHGFIRVHKSYLANFRFIKSISSAGILLDDGKTLPVGRTRLEEIKHTFRRLTL